MTLHPPCGKARPHAVQGPTKEGGQGSGGGRGSGREQTQSGANNTVHAEVKGGSSQKGTRRMSGNVGTQSPARKEAHRSVDGGRKHGREALFNIIGTSDGDGADGGGSLMGFCDTAEPGGRDGATPSEEEPWYQRGEEQLRT